MGHYTQYKEYMKNSFWPWWWSEPCNDCDCIERGLELFDECKDYDEWLKRKPIYINKSLDARKKAVGQLNVVWTLNLF
jgi:hypothetical protein